MKKELIIQPPPPSSLLYAIRSIGYNFETAVADIIDNCISAEATEVRIYSNSSDVPYFCVLDNGIGMTFPELKNAMRLGSSRNNRPSVQTDLGRFGLGLKSASLSQCRRFTAVTKRNAKIFAITFDIDIIEETQEWNLVVLKDEDVLHLPEFQKLKLLQHGTLIIWQNFDKIENNTKNFDVSFRKSVAAAQRHVEFVFHRFYDEVSIFFNERRLERRDPFLIDSYGRQQQGRAQEIKVGTEKIRITPYTLPYANSLTREEKELLGNPKSIYDEQGLYLYRNRRLIAWGSWFHTEVRSELNKLARVQVDIPSTLDDIWMLDVKKSSAKIPDKIRETIRTAINESTNRSRGTVRHPGERELHSEQKVWGRFLADDKTTVKYLLNRDNPLLCSLKQGLGSKELFLLEHLLRQFESYIPKHAMHIDQAGDIFIADPWEHDESDLIDELVLKISAVEDRQDQEDLLDRYLRFETYGCLKSKKNEIMRRINDDWS